MQKLPTKVILKRGHYSLRRIRDGAGDSGPMFLAVNNKESLKQKTLVYYKIPGTIKVGSSVRCGTPFTRSHQEQDYWHTTQVKQILTVNKDRTEVKFKTMNGSTYIAKSF
jgi:hypothetical protein